MYHYSTIDELRILLKKSDEILDTLFSYSDYRLFLADYFSVKKDEVSGFSHRSFAKWAGFSAHNFLALVIKGERNLSVKSIHKLTTALKMNRKSALFFEKLVNLNQAKKREDKDRYYEELLRIGRKVPHHKVNESQYFFYEKWYYPVIRELMVMTNWNDDPGILAKMVRPAISVSDSREAVKNLLDSGMVSRSSDGDYTLAHDFVTSVDVPVYIKKKARRDVLSLGVETVESIAPSEKYVSYSTVPLSKSLYNEAREMMDRVRESILAQVSDDTDPEEVYEMVFQLFPVTQRGAKND